MWGRGGAWPRATPGLWTMSSSDAQVLLVLRESSLLLRGHDFFVFLSSAVWLIKTAERPPRRKRGKAGRTHFWPELHQIVEQESALPGEGKAYCLWVLLFLDNRARPGKHGRLNAGHVRSLQHPTRRDRLGGSEGNSW